MKTESTILADNFKSGSLKPIIEKMIEEFPEHGLQGNVKISKTDFASYFVGKLVARFGKRRERAAAANSYAWTDKFVYQENQKKPASLGRTLQKLSFATAMLDRPQSEKDIYADIVLLPKTEMNQVLFWGAFFGEEVAIERERIGEKIKLLREEAGLTQEQLAEKTGLRRPNIARIESGKYSTGQDILSKIAAAVGKQLDFL